MARTRAPLVPEQVRPRAIAEQLKARSEDFVDRRDLAVPRLFPDTGMRLAELRGLRLEDVDLDDQVATVVGKGRRPRACPIGDLDIIGDTSLAHEFVARIDTE